MEKESKYNHIYIPDHLSLEDTMLMIREECSYERNGIQKMLEQCCVILAREIDKLKGEKKDAKT